VISSYPDSEQVNCFGLFRTKPPLDKNDKLSFVVKQPVKMVKKT